MVVVTSDNGAGERWVAAPWVKGVRQCTAWCLWRKHNACGQGGEPAIPRVAGLRPGGRGEGARARLLPSPARQHARQEVIILHRTTIKSRTKDPQIRRSEQWPKPR